MNKTMDAIANATRTARRALEHQEYFGMQTFGKGKYSVSVATNLKSENMAVTVWYRGTCVVNYANGKVRFENSRYYTPTTKNVMNAALFGLSADLAVYQKDYAWFVNNLPYVNGHEYPAFRDRHEFMHALNPALCKATGRCPACEATTAPAVA